MEEEIRGGKSVALISYGHCFICLNETEEDSDRKFQRFHYVPQYINMDKNKMFPDNADIPEDIIELLKLKVELCEDCKTINEDMEVIYLLLERCKMELDLKVKLVHEKMSEADSLQLPKRFRKKIWATGDQEKMDRVEYLERARREALRSCAAKLNRQPSQSRHDENNLFRKPSTPTPSTSAEAADALISGENGLLAIKYDYEVNLNDDGEEDVIDMDIGETKFDCNSASTPNGQTIKRGRGRPPKVQVKGNTFQQKPLIKKEYLKTVTGSPDSFTECDICKKQVRVRYLNVHKYRAHVVPQQTGEKGKRNSLDGTYWNTVAKRDDEEPTPGPSFSSKYIGVKKAEDGAQQKKNKALSSKGKGRRGPHLYPCNICKKSFKLRYLNVHKLMAHRQSLSKDQKKSEATDANNKSSGGSSPITATTSDGTMTSKCELCGIEIQIRSMRRHIRNRHPEMKYFCRICTKPFETMTSFQEHMKTSHSYSAAAATDKASATRASSSDAPPLPNGGVITKDYKCLKCGKSFSALASLKKHKTFQKNCNSQNQQNQQHNHQVTTRKNMQIRGKIPCKICGKMIHQSTMKRHVDSVHLGRRHYCPISTCGKNKTGFSQPNEMKLHMKRCHDVGEAKIFKCAKCQKVFIRKSKLTEHETSCNSTPPVQT